MTSVVRAAKVICDLQDHLLQPSAIIFNRFLAIGNEKGLFSPHNFCISIPIFTKIVYTLRNSRSSRRYTL